MTKEIPLSDGYVFTVEETLDLEVEYSISPDEISKISDYDPNYWKYIGTKPKKGTRTVKAVIGRLNHNWTEEGVTAMLAKSGCPLKGSGAWLREAYLKLRPNYDGKGGYMGFPHAETSRWQRVRDGLVFFPGVWSGGAGRWYRDLSRVRYEFNASDRLCLVASSDLGTSDLALEPLETRILELEKFKARVEKVLNLS